MEHAARRNERGVRSTLGLLATLGLAGCASLDQVSYAPPAPAADHSTLLTGRESLSVLSLNPGMLPGPLGSNNVERAERICDRLTSTQPADVIVLLEVFDERARGVFVRRLRDRWPWIVRRSGGGSFLPEDSGILLASRLPIIADEAPRIAFQSFRAKGPFTRADYWSAKGVLGAEIDLGDGQSLCILATHLMADYEVIGQYEHVRRRQLVEVMEFGRRFVAGVPASRRTSVLLVGDLNVPAERVLPASGGLAARLVPTPEYQRLMEVLLRPTDLYRATHANDAGWTWNHDPHAPGADPALGPQRLDYGFHIAGLVPEHRAAERPFVKTSLVSQAPGVADHRGLLLEMVLRGKTAARVARSAPGVREAAPSPQPVTVAVKPKPPTVVARIDG